MSSLERYYQILELTTHASLEEVNRAYKDLVIVWHPDRLPKDNARLLEMAERKIKEINHARDAIREHLNKPVAPPKDAAYSYRDSYEAAKQRSQARSSTSSNSSTANPNTAQSNAQNS